MTRWAGKQGLIELQGPGVAPVIVAAVTAWTLSATRDKIDVTGMSDSSIVRVLGLPDYSGTFDWIWDDAAFIVQAASEYTAASAYTLVVYPNGQSATARYWIGPAFLDYDSSSGVKDSVKMKSNWVAAPGTSWARA